jgi:hypothetical protein
MRNIEKLLYMIILTLLVKVTSSQDFWELINSPDSIKIHDIAINDNNDLFAGAANTPYGVGGIYELNYQTQVWSRIGLENKSVYSLDISEMGYIYAGFNLGISRSIDIGETWQEVFSTFLNVTAIKAGYDSIVLAGSGDNYAIMRSSDYGENWNVVFTVPSSSGEWFTDFEFSENGLIFASSRTPTSGNEGVYVSEDLGLIWNYFGLTKDVYTIEFTNDSRLLAGTLGQGLFVYDFSLLQWNCIVSAVSVNDIVITQTGRIFIACDVLPNFNGGAMVSDDNGLSFYYINSGLYPDYSIDDFSLDQFGYLYGSTYGSKRLYKSVEPVITSINENSISLGKNLYSYPNPFSDFIEVDFINPEQSVNFSMLKILDITGKIILEIEGSITLPFRIDGHCLRSGMYLILLEKNGTVKWHKILHL